MGPIYSNPFVHTVYYSRELFDATKPQESKEVEHLIDTRLNRQRARRTDFAFNENVPCASLANGTFMRLNACCLLKLRLWCLYPSDSTPKKVAKYFARIILTPLAAVVDLIINIVLLVLKCIAWIALRIKYRDNQDDIEALWQNVTWQCKMVSRSLGEAIFVAWVSSIISIGGVTFASKHDMDLWGYKVIHYDKGETIPFDHHYVNDYEYLNEHFGAWFTDGTPEQIFDPQRVRYLEEHCGWTRQKLNETRISFHPIGDAEVVYSTAQDYTLLIRSSVTRDKKPTSRFFQVIVGDTRRLGQPIPMGTPV